MHELLLKKEIIWMNSVTFQPRLKICDPTFIQDPRSEHKTGKIRDPRQKLQLIHDPLVFQIWLICRKNPQSVCFLRPNPSIWKPIHPPLTGFINSGNFFLKCCLGKAIPGGIFWFFILIFYIGSGYSFWMLFEAFIINHTLHHRISQKAKFSCSCFKENIHIWNSSYGVYVPCLLASSLPRS